MGCKCGGSEREPSKTEERASCDAEARAAHSTSSFLAVAHEARVGSIPRSCAFPLRACSVQLQCGVYPMDECGGWRGGGERSETRPEASEGSEQSDSGPQREQTSALTEDRCAPPHTQRRRRNTARCSTHSECCTTAHCTRESSREENFEAPTSSTSPSHGKGRLSL